MRLETEKAQGVFDLFLEITRGNVVGVSAAHVWGHNVDVDTSTDPEDLWDYGGLYTFLAAASTLYISSDAAGDTEIEVTVEGLDASWAEQTVTVETDDSDGTTFVALTGTWIRVNKVYVSGTSAPSGTIYISSDNTDAGGDGIPDDTTTIQAIIDPGENRSHNAIYSIPAATTGCMTEMFADANLPAVSDEAVISFRVREFGSVFQLVMSVAISINNNHRRTYRLPYHIPAKSDVLMRVESTSADDTAVYGGFNLVLAAT